jgi:hypothetical protein
VDPLAERERHERRPSRFIVERLDVVPPTFGLGGQARASPVSYWCLSIVKTFSLLAATVTSRPCRSSVTLTPSALSTVASARAVTRRRAASITALLDLTKGCQ